MPGAAVTVATLVTLATVLAAAQPLQPTPAPVAAAETLWQATPLTAANTFTAGIEGPAVDAAGRLYVQNFARKSTVGRIDTATGKGVVFAELGAASVGNGMRIHPTANVGFVADYKTHTVWRVDLSTGKKTAFAQSNAMKQPNDLAISADGNTLWASDPNWGAGKGAVYRITSGKVVLAASDGLGTTNGIDVSPDGQTLWVNTPAKAADKKSDVCHVYAYPIDTTTQALGAQKKVVTLTGGGCDGMRFDTAGDLYVTRNPGGVVSKVAVASAGANGNGVALGSVLRDIPVLGGNPTNLCFGGADGRTVYVTEAEKKRVVQFRVDSPGLEWTRLHPKK